MVPHISIYNSLGIHRIFGSHLKEGIGHGSIVAQFGGLDRENESLGSVKFNFDKPSPPKGSSYIDIQLTRHSQNCLESFRRGYWPRIDCGSFWCFRPGERVSRER